MILNNFKPPSQAGKHKVNKIALGIMLLLVMVMLNGIFSIIQEKKGPGRHYLRSWRARPEL